MRLRGQHLWSERYDRPLQDIFAVQDEIRQQIVFALKVKITPEEQARFKNAPTNNLEAYAYYLRGLESSQRAIRETKKEANVQARQLLERAHEAVARRAATISDVALRESFLARIAENAEIMAAMAARGWAATANPSVRGKVP